MKTGTQARDIFDLKLLINQGAKKEYLSAKLTDHIVEAINNALVVGFSEFKAQVVSYLMPEYQGFYNSSEVWNKIQAEVIHCLEGMD